MRNANYEEDCVVGFYLLKEENVINSKEHSNMDI